MFEDAITSLLIKRFTLVTDVTPIQTQGFVLKEGILLWSKTITYISRNYFLYFNTPFRFLTFFHICYSLRPQLVALGPIRILWHDVTTSCKSIATLLETNPSCSPKAMGTIARL